jgi:signal transduction histidine kinase
MDGRPTAWERIVGIDPRVWDGILTASVLILSLSALWIPGEHDGRLGAREPTSQAAILVTVATLPLYRRRRQPLSVLVVVAVVVFAYGMARYPSSAVMVPLIVASYSAAAFRERSPRLVGAIAAAVVASVALQVDTRGNWVEWAMGAFFSVGVPVAVGRIMWNRRRRLERDREQAAREAVALERGRIARELHDVVAHSMSVMVVQAGGARAVLRRDPEDAERALRSIEDAGRTGLAELRRLLAVDGDARVLTPQPGVGEVGELLERMRSTGLSVELITEGRPSPLPPGVDLSVYRIVQEALTNTLKHAGLGAHARVVLRYEDGAVEIEVIDDGRGPSPGPAGGGAGLIGMRERVAFLGGELRSGPRPGGGFLIHAHIPVPEAGRESAP